jgi:hypothetical protein
MAPTMATENLTLLLLLLLLLLFVCAPAGVHGDPRPD